MLSEETATGQYPVEAVATMARIALEAEKSFPRAMWLQRLQDVYKRQAHAGLIEAEVKVPLIFIRT